MLLVALALAVVLPVAVSGAAEEQAAITTPAAAVSAASAVISDGFQPAGLPAGFVESAKPEFADLDRGSMTVRRWANGDVMDLATTVIIVSLIKPDDASQVSLAHIVDVNSVEADEVLKEQAAELTGETLQVEDPATGSRQAPVTLADQTDVVAGVSLARGDGLTAFEIVRGGSPDQEEVWFQQSDGTIVNVVVQRATPQVGAVQVANALEAY